MFDRAALVRLGGRARLRVLADSIRTGSFVSKVSREKGRGTALDRRGWVWPVCALESRSSKFSEMPSRVPSRSLFC
jgi:hypothetical protein